MKKYLVFGGILALALLSVFDLKEQARSEAARRLRPRGFETSRHAGWGTFGRETVTSPSQQRPLAAVESPEDIAKKYLKTHTEEMGLKEYHEMRPSIFQTPLGAKVSYQIFQDGLPIVGSEIRLSIGRDQKVATLDNRYIPLERVELSGQEILNEGQVQELMRVSNYLPDPTVGTEPSRVLFPIAGTNRAELAYVVSVLEPSGNHRPVQVLLRASDGQILSKHVSRAEFR